PMRAIRRDSTSGEGRKTQSAKRKPMRRGVPRSGRRSWTGAGPERRAAVHRLRFALCVLRAKMVRVVGTEGKMAERFGVERVREAAWPSEVVLLRDREAGSWARVVPGLGCNLVGFGAAFGGQEVEAF